MSEWGSPYFVKDWILEKITKRGLDVYSILDHAGCTHKEIADIKSNKSYRISERVAKILSSVFEIPLHSFFSDEY